MKTFRRILLSAFMALCAAALLFGCSPADNFDDYVAKVAEYAAPDGSKLFQNSNDEAYEQKVVRDVVMSHFAADLPEGKTTKKAIFLGYDGCRVDVLKYANEQPKTADGEVKSALLKVRGMGKLVFAYAGGPKGDDAKKQATSTAPGWATMLTGKWALEDNGHTVKDNGLYKPADKKTFLTEVAGMTNPKTGEKYRSSFTISWAHHHQVTYFNDIVDAKENGIPVDYERLNDDEAVLFDVLDRVSGHDPDKDTDAVFLTLEGTDHAGHDTGFGIQHDEYIDGFLSEDAYGYEIIKTIMNRATYAEEDWLFVMSTDHGGYKKSHGGQTVLERTTWLATNRPEYLRYYE